MEAVASPAAARRPSYLPLPAFLFEPRGPALYIVRAWLLTFVPVVAIAATLYALADGGGFPVTFPLSGAAGFVLVALFAPLAETVLMSGPLLLLHRSFGFGPAVLGSAALWGVLHGLTAPAWGLTAFWMFLVFSTAFLAWRPRGYGAAVLVTAAIHALQNSLPALLLFGFGMG